MSSVSQCNCVIKEPILLFLLENNYNLNRLENHNCERYDMHSNKYVNIQAMHAQRFTYLILDFIEYVHA